MNIELMGKVATVVATLGIPTLLIAIVKEMAARFQQNSRNALFDWLSSETVQQVVKEDEALQALCDEHRKSYIFERLHGIGIEKELRDVLTTFHKERAGRYTMRQVVDSTVYLTWTGKTFHLRARHPKVGYWFRKTFSLFSRAVAFLYLLALCLSFFVTTPPRTQYIFLDHNRFVHCCVLNSYTGTKTSGSC